jgi:hypothetical protein
LPAHAQAIIRRAAKDIWNEGRLDSADELFASDYVNHGGLITDLVRGPEAIKISVILFRQAFPALHIVLDDLSTVGEISTVHWTARNAGPGQRRANAAPAQPDTVTGAIRIRFRHGQIAESWTEWDQTAILQRLGLIDARAT